MSIEKEFIEHLDENIKTYADYIKKCRHHIGPESLTEEQYIHIARVHLYSILKFSIAEYLTEVFSNLPDTVEDDSSIESPDVYTEFGGIDNYPDTENEYCDSQCSPSSSESEGCESCQCSRCFFCFCDSSDSESSDSDY